MMLEWLIVFIAHLSTPDLCSPTSSLLPVREQRETASALRNYAREFIENSIPCQDAWVSGLAWMGAICGVEIASGARLIRCDRAGEILLRSHRSQDGQTITGCETDGLGREGMHTHHGGPSIRLPENIVLRAA